MFLLWSVFACEAGSSGGLSGTERWFAGTWTREGLDDEIEYFVFGPDRVGCLISWDPVARVRSRDDRIDRWELEPVDDPAGGVPVLLTLPDGSSDDSTTYLPCGPSARRAMSTTAPQEDTREQLWFFGYSSRELSWSSIEIDCDGEGIEPGWYDESPRQGEEPSCG